MTIDEMIKVLQAYKKGKPIEFRKKSDNSDWVVGDSPNWAWDFSNYDYRVKKNPTRLEVANKLWEETFGIANRFTNRNCPSNECKDCPFTQTSCGINDLKTWWNEEYKGETE